MTEASVLGENLWVSIELWASFVLVLSNSDTKRSFSTSFIKSDKSLRNYIYTYLAQHSVRKCWEKIVLLFERKKKGLWIERMRQCTLVLVEAMAMKLGEFNTWLLRNCVRGNFFWWLLRCARLCTVIYIDIKHVHESIHTHIYIIYTCSSTVHYTKIKLIRIPHHNSDVSMISFPIIHCFSLCLFIYLFMFWEWHFSLVFWWLYFGCHDTWHTWLSKLFL